MRLLIIVTLAFGIWTAAAPGQVAAPGVKPAPAVQQPDPQPAVEPKQTTADPDDIKVLHKVGVDADGESLLTYFRERTYNEADPKQMDKWVAQLGSDIFQLRERAYVKIQALGPAAAVGLKNARTHKDIEIRKRVAELLRQVQEKANAEIQAAAARVVSFKKPKDGAKVLLNFLPYADKDAVDEIILALGRIAVINGKADPVLVAALQDKSALKRGGAGEALARGKAKQQWDNLKKLLEDKDAEVRFRVAMAMVHSDAAAIPVLIDLMAEYPPEKLWRAESLLVRLAGEKTPPVSLGTTQASRKTARDAWRKWYDGLNGKIDLTILTKITQLGYTLVMHQVPYRVVNGKRIRGRVMELGLDKKTVRWQFNIETYPVDGEVIGHNEVLIAEYQYGRISVRDFKGNVKWMHSVGGNPLGVQKLPNGNIFVTMRNRLVELDRNKKVVFDYQRGQFDIYRGRKMPNGEIIFVTNSGQLSRMESKTRKILKTFPVGSISYIYGSIAVNDKGDIAVPLYGNNQLVIFDKNGQRKKTITVQRPNSAVALPTGHFLIGSVSGNVYEFDRAGRQIWSYAPGGMIYNLSRR